MQQWTNFVGLPPGLVQYCICVDAHMLLITSRNIAENLYWTVYLIIFKAGKSFLIETKILNKWKNLINNKKPFVKFIFEKIMSTWKIFVESYCIKNYNSKKKSVESVFSSYNLSLKFHTLSVMPDF